MSAPTPDLAPHLDAVRAMCRRRIRDRHLAEDAVQEAALVALKNSTQLRDPTRIRSWLYRVAVRRISDEVRRRRAEPTRSNDFTDVPDPGVAATGIPAIDPLGATTPNGRRRCTSGGPSAACRPSFVGRCGCNYLQGRSVREIANMLGATTNAIKTRLYRARRMLRTEISR